MKLSIITINLNNLEGLTKTIDSVLGQSFTDYEFIIIDGASTDGSVDLIKEKSKLSLKIFWVSERDSGVFNAMNKGIRRSRGDYLLFLNSGDFLVNNNVLSDVFSKPRTDDLLLGQLRVTSEGKQIWLLCPQNNYTLDYFYRGSIAHQASFIRRDLFQRFGLYREDLKFMGDWEFSLRAIVLNECSVMPLKIVIADYNVQGMSSSLENRQKMIEEKERVYVDLHLSRIIPDYYQRDEWSRNNKAVEWASHKLWLRQMMEAFYKGATWIHRIKESVKKEELE